MRDMKSRSVHSRRDCVHRELFQSMRDGKSKNSQEISTATYTVGSATAVTMVNFFSQIKSVVPSLGKFTIGGSLGNMVAENATASTVLAVTGISIAAAYSAHQYLSNKKSKRITKNKDYKGANCIGVIGAIAAVGAATAYTSYDPISAHSSLTSIFSLGVGTIQANVLSGLTQIAGIYFINQGAKSAYNPCASAVIKAVKQGKKVSKVVLKDVKTSTAVAVTSGIAVGSKTGSIPLILSGAVVGYGVTAVGANIVRSIGKGINGFLKNRWKDIKDLNNPMTRTVLTGFVLNEGVRLVSPVAESVYGSSFQASLWTNLGVMVAAVTTDKWRPTVLNVARKATMTLINRVKNAPAKVKLWTGLVATTAGTAAWFWMSKGNGVEGYLDTVDSGMSPAVSEVFQDISPAIRAVSMESLNRTPTYEDYTSGNGVSELLVGGCMPMLSSLTHSS
ncbi:MAG: hypothetical protein VX737_00380 [Pseudomonadota bacterium]|nr:hypothetical protein [Pseudomonadota bacterium]